MRRVKVIPYRNLVSVSFQVHDRSLWGGGFSLPNFFIDLKQNFHGTSCFKVFSHRKSIFYIFMKMSPVAPPFACLFKFVSFRWQDHLLFVGQIWVPLVVTEITTDNSAKYIQGGCQGIDKPRQGVLDDLGKLSFNKKMYMCSGLPKPFNLFFLIMHQNAVLTHQQVLTEQ
jgi:hypothetical protein